MWIAPPHTYFFFLNTSFSKTLHDFGSEFKFFKTLCCQSDVPLRHSRQKIGPRTVGDFDPEAKRFQSFPLKRFVHKKERSSVEGKGNCGRNGERFELFVCLLAQLLLGFAMPRNEFSIEPFKRSGCHLQIDIDSHLSQPSASREDRERDAVAACSSRKPRPTAVGKPLAYEVCHR